MKRKLFVVIALLMVLVSAAAVYAASVACPIDGERAFFTGQMKRAENGNKMWLFRCERYSHEFWVVSDSQPE